MPDRNECYILAGLGNIGIIDKSASGSFGAKVVMPMKVVSGQETLREFVLGEIEHAKSLGLAPVVVFPARQDAGYAGEAAYKRLNISSALYRMLFKSVYRRNVKTCIQCLGQVYRIADVSSIDDHLDDISHDSSGHIIEIGMPKEGTEFNHEYLDDIGNFYSTDAQVYKKLTFSKSMNLLLQESKKSFAQHDSRFFIVVIQSNGYGPPGTLMNPDEVVSAEVMIAFNNLALEIRMAFEAFFTMTIDPLIAEKRKEISKKYSDKVKNVFERSVAVRDYSAEVTTREADSWGILRHAFPKLEFNHVDLTFVDTEETQRIGTARHRPITDLSTPKKYLKRVQPEAFKPPIINAVNFLWNKKRDRTEKATTRTKAALEKFTASVIKHDERRDQRAEDAVSAIIGTYLLDDAYDIIITNDPVAIFAKSTGQDWEETSCEKDGGSHNLGVYSDIEIGNCVAFIVERSNGHPIARIMVRWCEENKGKKIGFGIEKKWYFATAPGKGAKIENTSKDLIYKGMPVVKATAALVKILKEKNMYDYDTCTTPYTYMGYSDEIGTSRQPIAYDNLLVTNKYLFGKYLGGFKIDFTKVNLRELYDIARNEPDMLDDLADAEYDFFIKTIINNNTLKLAKDAASLILNHFLSNKEKYDKLAIAMLDSSPEHFFGILDMSLHSQIRNLMSDYLEQDRLDKVFEMLSDPVYNRFPIAISEILSRICEWPTARLINFPYKLVLQYQHRPIVLMTALFLFDKTGNQKMFEWCVVNLSAMYNLDAIMARLKIENRDTISSNGRNCPAGNGKVGDYYYCRGDVTDKFFITYDYVTTEVSIGISVIHDTEIETNGPRAFRYSPIIDDKNIKALSRKENFVDRFKSISTEMQAAARHLYKVLSEINADKLKRYPDIV